MTSRSKFNVRLDEFAGGEREVSLRQQQSTTKGRILKVEESGEGEWKEREEGERVRVYRIRLNALLMMRPVQL